MTFEKNILTKTAGYLNLPPSITYRQTGKVDYRVAELLKRDRLVDLVFIYPTITIFVSVGNYLQEHQITLK